jgi:hypothetical protein
VAAIAIPHGIALRARLSRWRMRCNGTANTMRLQSPRSRLDAGFSFVEVMIATLLLATSLTALAALRNLCEEQRDCEERHVRGSAGGAEGGTAAR